MKIIHKKVSQRARKVSMMKMMIWFKMIKMIKIISEKISLDFLKINLLISSGKKPEE